LIFLYFGLCVAAIACSSIGVQILLRWAKHRMLDIPNQRSTHTNPTPRGGGLAIVVTTLLGLFVLQATVSHISWSLLVVYSLAAAMIAAVSWLDDLRSLSNRVRFATHSVAALLLIGAGFFWSEVEMPFLGLVTLGWLGMLPAFVWMVGLTNVYNFMDGIDGIAGSQAVLAGVGWLLLGWTNGDPFSGVLGALLAASSLGFLAHNWPPARIFMGDVGSAFLGYSFAALAVVAAQSAPRMAIVGILLVWPFVFDSTFTLLRRWRKGENIFAAHRSHLYQRLVIAGYSHRFVTLLYSFLALVGTFLALLWVWAAPGADWLVVSVPALLSFGLWGFVVRAEARPYPDGSIEPPMDTGEGGQ